VGSRGKGRSRNTFHVGIGVGTEWGHDRTRKKARCRKSGKKQASGRGQKKDANKRGHNKNGRNGGEEDGESHKEFLGQRGGRSGLERARTEIAKPAGPASTQEMAICDRAIKDPHFPKRGGGLMR